MCRICADIVPDFGVEHVEQLCPFRNSWYCSYCASYGHLTKKCPAKPLRRYREPCYEEQLLPPSLLQEQNRTSKTPIVLREEYPPRFLVMKDEEKAMSEYLLSVSFKIPKGFTKREALEEYAKQTNQRIVYENK
jgi:hypothetical protein